VVARDGLSGSGMEKDKISVLSGVEPGLLGRAARNVATILKYETRYLG
jgi:hypothetical protein